MQALTQAFGYVAQKKRGMIVDMKPVNEIRRANLMLLIQEAGSQAKLSRIAGVPSSYISQVSRGVKHSAGNGAERNMGDDMARRFENKMGKPTGWMDADHSLPSMSDLSGREGQLVGLFRLLSESDQAALVSKVTEALKNRASAAPDEPLHLTKH